MIAFPFFFFFAVLFLLFNMHLFELLGTIFDVTIRTKSSFLNI